MRTELEKDIHRLLLKLRASGHAVDVDALAHSIHKDHRDIGLEALRDRIRVHVSRIRNAKV